LLVVEHVVFFQRIEHTIKRSAFRDKQREWFFAFEVEVGRAENLPEIKRERDGDNRHGDEQANFDVLRHWGKTGSGVKSTATKGAAAKIRIRLGKPMKNMEWLAAECQLRVGSEFF
jgi:hypothetical protein